MVLFGAYADSAVPAIIMPSHTYSEISDQGWLLQPGTLDLRISKMATSGYISTAYCDMLEDREATGVSPAEGHKVKHIYYANQD